MNEVINTGVGLVVNADSICLTGTASAYAIAAGTVTTLVTVCSVLANFVNSTSKIGYIIHKCAVNFKVNK